MKLITILLCLSTFIFASQTGFIENLDEAKKIAKLQKKDIYMLVSSNHCKWCKKFKRTTLQDTQTMKRLQEQYVLVLLNKDTTDIPSQYDATQVPKHYFINEDGDIIDSLLGYYNAEDFGSYIKEIQVRQ